MAKVWAEVAVLEPDIICEKEVLFCPCPVLGWVLATYTSEPAIAKGAECAVDPVRSITSALGFQIHSSEISYLEMLGDLYLI